MSTYRQAEIYLQRRIVSALNIAKVEGQTAESIAERYLEERLKADFPGIFDVIDESEAAFDLARADNKKRIDEWRNTLKQL